MLTAFANDPEFRQCFIRNLAHELAVKRAQATEAASVHRARARKVLVIPARQSLIPSRSRVSRQAPTAASSRPSDGGDDRPEDGRPSGPIAAVLSTLGLGGRS